MRLASRDEAGDDRGHATRCAFTGATCRPARSSRSVHGHPLAGAVVQARFVHSPDGAAGSTPKRTLRRRASFRNGTTSQCVNSWSSIFPPLPATGLDFPPAAVWNRDGAGMRPRQAGAAGWTLETTERTKNYEPRTTNSGQRHGFSELAASRCDESRGDDRYLARGAGGAHRPAGGQLPQGGPPRRPGNCSFTVRRACVIPWNRSWRTTSANAAWK